MRARRSAPNAAGELRPPLAGRFADLLMLDDAKAAAAEALEGAVGPASAAHLCAVAGRYGAPRLARACEEVLSSLESEGAKK